MGQKDIFFGKRYVKGNTESEIFKNGIIPLFNMTEKLISLVAFDLML